MGPGGFFPTNPDLADILGRTDFDFENFYFLDFLGSQLGPGLGQAWTQAWAQTPPAPPHELSDPNLTPLPTHPGTKYVARTLAAIYNDPAIFFGVDAGVIVFLGSGGVQK